MDGLGDDVRAPVGRYVTTVGRYVTTCRACSAPTAASPPHARYLKLSRKRIIKTTNELTAKK